MPQFHIHTLGCKVNRAESETIAAALIDAGWTQCEAQAADVAIVNTCTVTGEADTKNRKIIRGLLKAGAAHVIVTGCAINIASDHYAELGEAVVCEPDKSALPRTAQLLVQEMSQSGSGTSSARAVAPDAASTAGTAELNFEQAPLLGTDAESMRMLNRTGEGFRTRVDVKIQDGCNNACTYCIVHVARGKAHSIPASQVIGEVGSIANAGTREVVLVGIDLGAYDDNGLDLADLMEILLQRTEIGRLRISSIEPQSLKPSLITALATSDGRICRHLHLCLQSGSTKVLDEMSRNYTADEFLDLIAELRAQVPSIALSTDVIVGFPGETDEDFAQTCKVIEQARFMRLHVFRYSKRAGTPAAARPDQIPPQVMAERAKTLRELGAKLALEDMHKRLGTAEQVIVERPGIGTSESYHKVLVPTDLAPGLLLPMELADIDEGQHAFSARVL